MNVLRKLKWRRLLIELIIIVAVVAGFRAYQQRDLPQGVAPALEGVLLDGSTISLDALAAREGGVLVHFWATWCPICKLEQGTINALAADYPVITVAMTSGSAQEVQEYLTENRLSYPVVNDPRGEAAAAWGVRGVPTTFVLDGQRRIRFAEVGYTTEWGLRARLWWTGVGQSRLRGETDG